MVIFIHNSIPQQLFVKLDEYELLEGYHNLKDVLKSASMRHGEQCVMMLGMLQMLE